MNAAKLFIHILNLAFTALFIVACGGSSSFAPPAEVGVNITAANAELITATIVKSGVIVDGVSIGPRVLASASAQPLADRFNYPDFFLDQVQRLPALASQPNNATISGVVIPESTHDCTEIGGTSGTYTESGNVSDPATVSVNDLVNIDFNNCVIYGITLNGGISLTVTAITANFDGMPPYTLGLDAVLSGFSMNDADFVITSDGDMSMLFTTTISGDHDTLVSGASLSVSVDGETEQLTNYQFDISENDISGDFSVDLLGTIATTAIGGAVSYETTTAFTGNDFVLTGEPTAGVMHITTTADNSQARVTAQPDGVNVEIKVDANGDALYESTIMTTWTALHN